MRLCKKEDIIETKDTNLIKHNEQIVKVCVICNTEKSIDKFYNKYRENKQCNNERSLGRYYENKDKLSNQGKKYYEKNRDVLLAKSKVK